MRAELTPGGARLAYRDLALDPGPADIAEDVLRGGTAAELGTLACLCRDLFLEHHGAIEFGPVIAGAVYELRLQRPPAAIFVRDGYLNVHLPGDAGHLHLGIASSSENARLDATGMLERARRCTRAALFEGFAAGSGLATTWGARLWNGEGAQMITFFFQRGTGAQVFRLLQARYPAAGGTTMRPSASM